MLTDASGLEFPLEPALEVVRLGRGLDNDVVLASTHVSRYHTQLRWVESSWLVYDLDSTNGTWVDDERLQAGQARALRVGNRLRLGDHQLEVRAVKAGRRERG
jgi:pSer/pThr/pTyr-binding forkhead associated (FHA) protein